MLRHPKNDAVSLVHPMPADDGRVCRADTNCKDVFLGTSPSSSSMSLMLDLDRQCTGRQQLCTLVCYLVLAVDVFPYDSIIICSSN